MRLLVHMEDPAYYTGSNRAVYSNSVSARFFQFLKPYFDEISVCAPTLPIDSDQTNFNRVSWSDLPIRLIPLPYWEGIGRFWLKSPRNVLKTVRIVRASVASHDVVWIRLPSESAPLIYAVAYAYRRPIILHVGGNIRIAWRAGQSGLVSRVMRRAVSEMMHRQTRVMAWRAPTLMTGLELLDLYGKGARNASVFVDSQFSESQIVDWRDTCTGSVINVLFVGQLRRPKGVFELLDVVGSLDVGKKVVARIVGYGPLAEELERVAASGEMPYLRYEGYVPSGERLLRLYRESDIFVLPSTTYPEGFPRAILEAWAAALPVVASAVGGIPGTVVDGHNGLLVSPGSVGELQRAIQRIISDEELRRTLIRNGLESAREFTGEQQAKLAIELLIKSHPHLEGVWPDLGT